MTYSLIKELLESSESLGTLTSTVEFQAINGADPKIAKALKLQWGHPEFLVYVSRILTSIAKKKSEFNHITPDVKIDLSRLVKLHLKTFPKIEIPKAMQGVASQSLKAGLTESQYEEFLDNLNGLMLIE